MPKNKKTRKQKMLADNRHRDYMEKPLQQIQPEHNKPGHNDPVPKQAIITAHYSYLYPDLLKTLILTISIIVAELALRYFAFDA